MSQTTSTVQRPTIKRKVKAFDASTIVTGQISSQGPFFGIAILETLSSHKYELTHPIDLLIQYNENDVIVRYLPLNIFSYAETKEKAIKAFGSLLIEDFEILKKKQSTLAPNLREEFHHLSQLIHKK